jgi:hypothetical protein
MSTGAILAIAIPATLILMMRSANDDWRSSTSWLRTESLDCVLAGCQESAFSLMSAAHQVSFIGRSSTCFEHPTDFHRPDLQQPIRVGKEPARGRWRADKCPHIDGGNDGDLDGCISSRDPSCLID